MLVAHGLFVALDSRLPRDMNLVHEALPSAFEQLWRPGPTLALVLSETTGWLNALIALLLKLTGRAPETLSVLHGAWLGLLVVSVGRTARVLAGPVAAFVAVALVAGMPGVVIAARIGWVHVPEAALIFAALAAWVGDPRLERRRTLAVVVGCGALVLALRPSGAAWAGTLALAILVARPPRRRALLVLTVFALAALPLLLELPEYLQAKARARERYSLAVPDLHLQVLAVLGVLPGLLLVPGLLRWGRRGWRSSSGGLLAAWIVLPVVLVAVFQSGVDNHTVFGPALAVAAGMGVAGMASGRARQGLALAPVAGALLLQLPLMAPSAMETTGLAYLPGMGSFRDVEDINGFTRPYDVFGEDEVRGLLEATCAGAAPGACRIVVDQGLFYPFVEDAGFLELFLMDERRVALVPLWEPGAADMLVPPRAMSTFDCGDGDAMWRLRRPNTLQRWQQLTQTHQLEPAWARKISRSCMFIWLTPEGQLANADALPFWRPPPKGGPPPRERGRPRGR